MRIRAEVSGRFEKAGDCDKLLYAPLSEPLTYRHTRVYDVEFEGDGESAETFVRAVLLDGVSQELHLGDEPAIEGAVFHLDYGMKAGALDLEKETVARYHGELEVPGFELNSLKITQRIYVFGQGDSEISADRFVRDIVNPAIHTWNVCDRRNA